MPRGSAIAKATTHSGKSSFLDGPPLSTNTAQASATKAATEDKTWTATFSAGRSRLSVLTSSGTSELVARSAGGASVTGDTPSGCPAASGMWQTRDPPLGSFTMHGTRNRK